jgi:hypothetical protein
MHEPAFWTQAYGGQAVADIFRKIAKEGRIALGQTRAEVHAGLQPILELPNMTMEARWQRP